MPCFLEQALQAAAEIALLKSRLAYQFSDFQILHCANQCICKFFLTYATVLLYMQTFNLFKKKKKV